MSDFIIEFSQIIITMLATLLGPVIANFSLKGHAWLKSKIGKQNLELLQDFTRIAVRAVEQDALKQRIANVGEVKLNVAVAKVREFAAMHNIKIASDEVIITLIESALHEGAHRYMERIYGTLENVEPAMGDLLIES